MPSLSNCCPSISRQARHWTKSFRGLGSHGLSGPPTHLGTRSFHQVKYNDYINKWLISHIIHIYITCISNRRATVCWLLCHIQLVAGYIHHRKLNMVVGSKSSFLLLSSNSVVLLIQAVAQLGRTNTQVPWDLHLWTLRCLQFCTTEDATKAERAGCHHVSPEGSWFTTKRLARPFKNDWLHPMTDPWCWYIW